MNEPRLTWREFLTAYYVTCFFAGITVADYVSGKIEDAFIDGLKKVARLVVK